MNLSLVYQQFIANRRTNPPLDTEYAEVHHVIPRCMGGTNASSNLIRLRPEDHLFAHYLLAKMHWSSTSGEPPTYRSVITVSPRTYSDLWCAVAMMTGHENYAGSRLARRPYGEARRNFGQTVSGENSFNFQRKRYPGEYELVNLITEEQLSATTYTMGKKLHVDSYEFDRIVGRATSSYKGWALVEEANDAFLPNRRYRIKHSEHGTREGTFTALMRETGCTPTTTSNLINGRITGTKCGWKLIGKLVGKTWQNVEPRTAGTTKGYRHTPETRAKLSECQLGRKASAETRLKQSQARRGRKNSAEAIRKTAEALRGRPKTTEHKQKLRQIRLNEALITCPHCGHTARGKAIMTRWHFTNCKKHALVLDDPFVFSERGTKW